MAGFVSDKKYKAAALEMVRVFNELKSPGSKVVTMIGKDRCLCTVKSKAFICEHTLDPLVRLKESNGVFSLRFIDAGLEWHEKTAHLRLSKS